MHKSIFYLILATICLTGCATASKTYDAEGKEAYTLNCSGTMSSWARCYTKAGEKRMDIKR